MASTTVASRASMKWSSSHDIALSREILLFRPWIHRRGSTERGQIWENIAKSLNALEMPKFHVSQRSVRDRYQLLEKKYKRKQSEERASGISPEESELDEAMEDIIAQFEEADHLNEQLTFEKKQRAQAEVEKAVEMRRCSMETFKETKKRNGEEENNEPSAKKKKRTSGSDVMRYLREKGEIDIKMKADEVEVRRTESERHYQLMQEELRIRRLEAERQKEENEQQVMQLTNSQMMQQQQMKQLFEVTQGMMLQQQQQSASFVAIFEKFATKFN
ncbi:inner centromere protein-like [Xenia sp. Carnegie-2017]|uniref:inner centromere protein-like n=1 Tax=Xenia sp. Carnegie-2017 TaxID=2897299 RepID=UPI001F0369A6|nr:inner centromere protein-like [Xenia sp. Carnegie-2017]